MSNIEFMMKFQFAHKLGTKFFLGVSIPYNTTNNGDSRKTRSNKSIKVVSEFAFELKNEKVYRHIKHWGNYAKATNVITASIWSVSN